MNVEAKIEKNMKDDSQDSKFCALIFLQNFRASGGRDTAKVRSAARRKNKCGRDKIRVESVAVY